VPAFDRQQEREDLEREQLARNVIYLRQPVIVCGEPLNNITPHLLTVLTVMRTPFYYGGKFNHGHVAQFLWACHVDYSPRAWWKRHQLIKRASRLDLESAAKEIDDFIALTFMDAPKSGNSKEKPIAADIAWLVYRFRHDPWRQSRDVTIHTPFRELYQELRCWKKEHTEEYIENKSDKHIADWSEQVNAMLKDGRITQAQLDAYWARHRKNN